MACRSADAGAIALGAEAVVADVAADPNEQIHVVGKTALIQVKNAVGKNATDAICTVVSQAPWTFTARVVEMRRIPGLVRETLLFGPPAQFFSDIATWCGAATGLPQPCPGRSRDGQKGGCRENVNALVDVIGGLG